jgi:hypothetical protein
MDTLTKLRILDTFSEFDKPLIEMLGKQSIKGTFKCGCTFVQHGFTGTARRRTPTEAGEADRAFFVELCKYHNR